MGKLNRVQWCLLGGLIVILVLAASSAIMPNRLTGTVKLIADTGFAQRLRAPQAQKEARGQELIETVVESVRLSRADFQPVVILKEKNGDIRLPIWIGSAEANAISVMLEGVKVPRPLTADLLGSIIQKTGGRIDYVVINDLQNQVFYAYLMVNANWTQVEIDSRPSDAIAVALRAGAPIYVEKAVLDKAGIQPEQKGEKYTVWNKPWSTPRYLTPPQARLK